VRLDDLSRREREVFDLVVDGKRSADIAARLGISTRTVCVHRANIHRKLDAHSAVELVRAAAKAGLLKEGSS